MMYDLRRFVWRSDWRVIGLWSQMRKTLLSKVAWHGMACRTLADYNVDLRTDGDEAATPKADYR